MNNDKELIAQYAANQVKDGMLVGLGTGSTANCFIAQLARRCREQQLKVTTVSSSNASANEARKQGLSVLDFEQISQLDMYVDGADEVCPDLTLLKGQGADLVREKILATACEQFWVLVEHSKLVQRIGQKFAIPIEVMPFAWQCVKKQLEKSGGIGELRQNSAKNGYAISSYGSLILDMRFDEQISIQTLNSILNSTPGVIEHGIFYALTNTLLIGKEGQIQEIHSVNS